ncbi:hypothetical protein VZO05_14140 [Aggregatilineales bacterium SYSU G02658]
MNLNIAQRIIAHVANLTALASTFQAKFGRDYRLTGDSPAAAWELYRSIMAEQTNIASLLEPAALQTPYSRYGKWWERRDVIDQAILNELGADAMTLVERCAYLSAEGKPTENSPVLLVVQQSIAGMLHPSTRPVAVKSPTVQEAV